MMREHTGSGIDRASLLQPQAEQPYSEDKRTSVVRDALTAIHENLASMRHQRSELDWNIRAAEESLASMSSDLLNQAAQVPTKRAG